MRLTTNMKLCLPSRGKRATLRSFTSPPQWLLPLTPQIIEQSKRNITHKLSSKGITINWEHQLSTINPSSSSSSLDIKYDPQTYSYIWLRHNCGCKECKEESSQNRRLNFTPQSLLSASPSSPLIFDDDNKEVRVEWNDGHKSRYSFSFLENNKPLVTSYLPSFSQEKLWNNEILKEVPKYQYHDIMHTTNNDNDHGLYNWMEGLYDYGVTLIENVPISNLGLGDDSGSDGSDGSGGGHIVPVIQVASRISYIRETSYNRHFDVMNIPNTTNIAYTTLPLTYHMDLGYYEVSPGFQYLHCIAQSDEGGVNYFADSLYIAERFRMKYPSQFEILSEVPIPYVGSQSHSSRFMTYSRPLITVKEGMIIGVFHSPQFQGTIKFRNEDIMHRYYDAYCLFLAELELEEYKVEYKMKAGDMLAFNNRRVFHARSSFNPSHFRHLQGTYSDTDEFINRFKSLSHRFNRPFHYKRIGNFY